MHPRIRLAAIGAPIILILLTAAIYAVDLGVYRERVPRNVWVQDVELSGLTRAEALAELDQLEEDYGSTPIPVVANGGQATPMPADLGLGLDREAIVDQAMAVGRDGGPIGSINRWFSSLSNETRIGPVGTIDNDTLEASLMDLNVELVDNPPFPGRIRVVGESLEAEYPRPGLAIEPTVARERLAAAYLEIPRPTVTLDLVTSEPSLTRADVDAALAEATRLVDGPITLTAPNPDKQFVVTSEDLLAAFTSEIVRRDGVTRIVTSLDSDRVIALALPLVDELATKPVDAEFLFDDETKTVSVINGWSGTTVELDSLAEALIGASTTATRTGELPVIEGVEPDVTVEELTEMGITSMVSSFTTYHDCCQARVTNIQNMADAVTGAIVMPGETFSLNDRVGPRTLEKGYLPAGTIIAGQLEDTVGGGVSQFSTTLYNAVFWGGFEDIAHTPHSYYFSRYPEGIEATLDYGTISNKFRNDTDKPILLRTRYTGTSITVQIWGDNDGRIVEGDQWQGKTTIDVLAEGGPNARRVTAEVSGRFDWTDPQPQYEPDETVAPGRLIVEDKGGRGWTVTVKRTIEQAGGITEQDWTVRYRYKPILTRVNPCMLNGRNLLPEIPETCPPNLPPVVNAAGPGSTNVGVGVTVSAAASDDWTHDEALVYSWSASGPGGASFGSPGTASSSVTFDTAGSYTVTVTVTDGAAQASQSSIAIDVVVP